MGGEEDYGQAVTYEGTVEACPHAWALDARHVFETGRCVPVSGNTWHMLHDSRFAKHFRFFGSKERHLGPFPSCGKGKIPFASAGKATGSGGCS
eukprot:GDKH01006323.1.p2 GENE.GDKH01006323.1~~GDKH01006323.1.p2  ORF type:complete len:94 (-),score=23.78 GDKH01006323.1:310-591(-)